MFVCDFWENKTIRSTRDDDRCTDEHWFLRYTLLYQSQPQIDRTSLCGVAIVCSTTICAGYYLWILSIHAWNFQKKSHKYFLNRILHPFGCTEIPYQQITYEISNLANQTLSHFANTHEKFFCYASSLSLQKPWSFFSVSSIVRSVHFVFDYFFSEFFSWFTFFFVFVKYAYENNFYVFISFVFAVYVCEYAL